MPDNMFRDVVDPSIKVGGRRGYTVPFSIVVHTLAVVAAVVFPLVVTNGDRWPTPPTLLAFVGAPPPPPAATGARTAASAGGKAGAGRESGRGPDRGAARDHRRDPEPVQPIVARRHRRHRRGRDTGRRGRTRRATATATATAATRDAACAGSGRRRHQTTGENQGRLPGVSVDRPDRPRAGRGDHRSDHQPGGQGAGREECCVPFRLLDAAALDAVRQWEYTPTLLNGVPVPVVMTVTDQFSVAVMRRETESLALRADMEHADCAQLPDDAVIPIARTSVLAYGLNVSADPRAVKSI